MGSLTKSFTGKFVCVCVYIYILHIYYIYIIYEYIYIYIMYNILYLHMYMYVCVLTIKGGVDVSGLLSFASIRYRNTIIFDTRKT